MKQFIEGEIVEIPMVVTDISESEHGKQYTMTYTETDTEYSMTIDDWALESLGLYSQQEEKDWYEQVEQIELIVSTKVEIAKEKINKFLRECHENEVDILSIEPIMSFTSVGDPKKRLEGAIMVGAMIRYSVPLYSSEPVDEKDGPWVWHPGYSTKE